VLVETVFVETGSPKNQTSGDGKRADVHLFYVPLPDGEQGHVRNAFGHCTQTETAFNQLSFVNNKEKSKICFCFLNVG